MNTCMNHSSILSIDGENIPYAFAYWIYDHALQKGKLSFACVYGNPLVLQRWHPFTEEFLLDTRTHHGGKNAADKLMIEEALRFYEVCHISTFFLATQDGDFTVLVRFLRSCGCEVHGIGGVQASPMLVLACTSYTFIGCYSSKKTVETFVHPHVS